MTQSARKKKNKGNTLRRFVYMFERIDNKTLRSRIQGRREIKIGIAKDAYLRASQVNRGVPGTIVILRKFKVDNASHVETFLHRKYKAFNFEVKGAKDGAGGTEFFRLTDAQIRRIEKTLSQKSKKRFSVFEEDEDFDTPPIILVFILSIGLMILIQYLKT